MLQGQGQTAGINVCSISFDSFPWSTSIKFLFLSPPFETRGILLCTCRSVGRLIVCRPSDVRSIFFDYSARKFPNLVQWMPRERVDVPYWFSGHIFKGEGQTAGLHHACCLLNILWPFDGYQTCCTHLLTLEIALWVTRSRSNYWFSFQHYLFNMLWTISW